jgi:hypothetical protein
MQLFRADEAVPDPNFRRYIENQRDRYEDDSEEGSAIVLVLLVCNKYDLLGPRNAIPGEATDQVVALKITLQPPTQEEKARSGRSKHL